MSEINKHERLVWMRTERGYTTAKDAADAYGWNEVTYRAHEAGDRGIKQSVAEKYCDAFRYSLSWFLTGRGSPDKTATDILDLWGDIPEHNRDAARRMLEGLAERKSSKFES